MLRGRGDDPVPTLRPWQRFSEWLRSLPPRRRQALTALTLISFAFLTVSLYAYYLGDPAYRNRMLHAGLVDTPPQGRASAGQAEADREQARTQSEPAALPPPAPPAATAEPPAAPPEPPAAVERLQAPVYAPAAQGFGWEYSSLYGDWRLHDGLDYAAPEGARVVAAAPGKVAAVSTDPREGMAVTIEHPGQLRTHYAGLAAVSVQPGETVTVGQDLGRVGAPGIDEAVAGPHLHFRVERQGQAVDPNELIG